MDARKTNKRSQVHHIACPLWMSDAVKDLGARAGRSDADIFRASLTAYLTPLGYSESAYLDRLLNVDNEDGAE